MPRLKEALHLLAFITLPKISYASSAAGQSTLVGVVGDDFVMLGADSSSSSSIALTSSNLDKIIVLSDPFPGRGQRQRNDISKKTGGNMDTESGYEDYHNYGRQQAIVAAAAGDSADADRLLGLLSAHSTIREYEANVGCDVECVFHGSNRNAYGHNGDVLSRSSFVGGGGLDAESVAHLARSEIAKSLRSGGQYRVCLLIAGMVHVNSFLPRDGHNDLHDRRVEDPQRDTNRAKNKPPFSSRIQMQVETASDQYDGMKKRNQPFSHETKDPFSQVDQNKTTKRRHLKPKLLWLDEYGSLQNLDYGAHGLGSNFILSILDQGYRRRMSREEAENLINDCFEQLRKRYVINSPEPPCIKCIDSEGCYLV